MPRPATRTTESPSTRLSRDDVLWAALELLNEVGIDALSTRRLAERLGVQSPTLYWHFKSKAQLLEAMSEAIMVRHHLPNAPQPGQAWQDWFVANAASHRRSLLAYRDGARLHAGTRPRGALQFKAIETKLRLLQDAGIAPEDGIAMMLAISRFVVGWVLEEQAMAPGNELQGDAPPASDYPLTAEGWQRFAREDADEMFERQVRLFVAGAQAALASGGSATGRGMDPAGMAAPRKR